MSASVAPNVACCRKRDASSGATIGTGGVPLTSAIKSAEVAGPGLGFRTCKSRLPDSTGFTVAVNCVPLVKGGWRRGPVHKNLGATDEILTIENDGSRWRTWIE